MCRLSETYSGCSGHVLIRGVLCAVHGLAARGIGVVFMWVPGHFGVAGGLEDRAAVGGGGLPSFTSHPDLIPMKGVDWGGSRVSGRRSGVADWDLLGTWLSLGETLTEEATFFWAVVVLRARDVL